MLRPKFEALPDFEEMERQRTVLALLGAGGVIATLVLAGAGGGEPTDRG